MHRRFIITMVIVGFIFAAVACTKEEVQTIPLEDAETEVVTEEPADQAYIYVHVCGAVVREGVYQLPVGSRVYEAIEMAGGFQANAEVAAINQAEVLLDETRLYVPTLEESEKEQSLEDGKVNLNTASKEELMTLSGVGETKAEQIIQYRQEHGRFRAIEDVMNISGIKEGLFEKIKDDITV